MRNLTLLIILFIFSFSLSGQQIDPLFGNNGIEFSAGGIIHDFIILPDGNIIAVGETENFKAIAKRYCNIYGSMCSGTFGTGGNYLPILNELISKAAVVKQNGLGQLYMAGSNGDNGLIVKFNSNGIGVGGFGVGNSMGIVNTPLLMGINDLEIAAYDRPIVVGTKDGKITIAKFLSVGIADPTFGNGSIAQLDLGNTSEGRALEITPDGKILVAGRVRINNKNNFVISKFNSNGTIDNSFGNNGIVITRLTINTNNDDLRVLKLLDNGKILVGGQAGANNFGLVRYNPDGSLDQSFGGTGIVILDFYENGSVDGIEDILPLPNGSFLVSGFSNIISNGDDFAISKFNESGNLDLSFGNNGRLTHDFSFGNETGNDHALQMELINGNTLIVAGGSVFFGYYTFDMIAYILDLNLGLLDDSKFNQQTLIYPNPVNHEANLKYELSSASKITISLFDITGKIMQQFVQNELRSKGQQIETLAFDSNIQNGNYIVTITDETGNSVSLKILYQF